MEIGSSGSGMDFGHKESLATKFKVDDVLMDVDGEVFVHGEDVAGQDGGRKLSCIDGINTTIYYKKNSHSD